MREKDPNVLRKCAMCEKEKPETEYAWKKKAKEKLKSKCSECLKQYHKEHYKKNKEKYALRAKKYYQENKDAVDKKSKEWRDNNKEKIAAYAKRYYENNKESYKKQKKQYREKNKERYKKYAKQYYENNKEWLSEYKKQWHENNKEHVYAHRKKKREEDPAFNLRLLVSSSIHHALKRVDGKKAGESVLDMLPYSIEQLRNHIESQFEAGMSWDNHGDWHIDHIYPHSKLPYDSMSHPNFKIAWDLRNLRPLWATENLSKGNRILPEAERILEQIKKDIE